VPRAVRIHATGGPEVLRFEEHDPGRPGPGQVLLRHTAIGVNFIDTYHRSGLYPLPLPAVLGAEGAGVVEALGEGVSAWRPGDRAAYATAGPGSYSEKRVLDAARLVRLPDDVPDRTAAASLLKGMTAEYLLRRAFPVRAGQCVLFHAAAGGVGLLAVQWLKALGALVIGTAGSEEKARLAREHGCDHVVLYRREKVSARVREITGGKGVAVVYDSVGKDTFLDSLDCLAPRGTLVSFGNASGKPDPLDPLVLSAKGSLYLTRPTLFHYCATSEDLAASAGALFAEIASGRLKVTVGRTWPLGAAAEAHRALEARETTGSCLLLP
jgi:NADPH2:quinone reductase